MKWQEITVNTTSQNVELIADIFFSIGCVGGVKIMDKNDVKDVLNSTMLWDYVDEKLFSDTDIAKVSGYVSFEELKDKIAQFHAIAQSYRLPLGEITVKEIDDENWYENWKKYYSPISIGKYLIVPKWMNVQNDSNQIVLLIDPGMAFGTGEHESTRMCLTFMSDLDFHAKDVIDVGTGSGILGIAAAKSGAQSCYMCDIDSVAVKAANENAAINSILNQVEIESADLLKKQNKTADIILANLTANILIMLSKDIVRHVRKNGTIICSGIIHERKQEVIDAFTSIGFSLTKEISMGEWNALRFTY